MKLALVAFLTMLMAAATAVAAEPMPELISFPNKNGMVIFSHKKHVEGHKNCKTCHDRKGGKIKGLGKEWAHKVCRGCHEAIMVGPVECQGCHGNAKK